MDGYVFNIIIFAAGFLLGALICYLILASIYKHRKVKDELLKTKRKAIKAQRTLERFVKNSLDLFSEMDEMHRQYATFLKDSIEAIAPKELDNFPYLSTAASQDGLFKRDKELEEEKVEKNLEKNETLDEIPTPNVLKSLEIPKPDDISEILNNDTQKPDDKNQDEMIKL